jgi:hypothetical protein
MQEMVMTCVVQLPWVIWKVHGKWRSTPRSSWVASMLHLTARKCPPDGRYSVLLPLFYSQYSALSPLFLISQNLLRSLNTNDSVLIIHLQNIINDLLFRILQNIIILLVHVITMLSTSSGQTNIWPSSFW